MELKYAEHRGVIRTGDFAFFRGRRLYARLIQMRTCSVFSHVGIFVWIGHGATQRLSIIEAMEGRGVQLLPCSCILTRDGSVDWYRLNARPADGFEIDREAVAGFAMRQWGRRYASVWQFFRSFGFSIPKFFGGPADTDPDRYFCSELAAEALAAGGYRDPEINVPAGCAPEVISRLACLQRRGVLVP